MKKIETLDAPKAIWPYSQAIKVNNFLYTSWQIALDPLSGEIVSEDIEEQTKQVCKNIWSILKSEWLDYSNVIKTTIYLKNMDDFEKVNKIYWEYFSHKPARSTVEVSNLPKQALVEIETIAIYE